MEKLFATGSRFCAISAAADERKNVGTSGAEERQNFRVETGFSYSNSCREFFFSLANVVCPSQLRFYVTSRGKTLSETKPCSVDRFLSHLFLI
jgi:hypothetical protein